MEVWNPYKFTDAGEVVTVLVLLMLVAVLAGTMLTPCQHRRRMVFLPLLLFWVFTILSATYFGRMETESGGLKLELFWTIRKAWAEHQGLYWYYIIGNILLFVPFGFLLPLIAKQMESVWIVTLIGAGMSLGIELFQYLTGTGLCELDDLFHNTLGTFSGYQLFVVMNGTVGLPYIKKSEVGMYEKRNLILSLSYIIVICLLVGGLLYLNKPDWTGIFY